MSEYAVDVRPVAAADVRGVRAATARIADIDFTKGVLVLLMVVYHWANYYFFNAEYVFRYLRFLTPSFIFITGFLLSQQLLNGKSQPHRARRVLVRGLKILAIFLALNIARGLLVGVSVSREALLGTFVTGNLVLDGTLKSAAFMVLVPISYLLMFSSLFFAKPRMWQYAVRIGFVVLALSVVVLGLNGVKVGYLELLSAGLLGAIIGDIPVDKIRRSITPVTVVLGFASYLIAMNIWGEVYLLQMPGVCVNLALIFVFYGETTAPGTVRQWIILLGRYSLFAYIVQIAVLQALRSGMRLSHPSAIQLAIILAATAVLTLVLVWIVDRARARFAPIDRVYVSLLG